MENAFLPGTADQQHPMIERDNTFVWRPFTQAKTARAPIPIVRGEGAFLFGTDGRRYFDATSSWWVTLHGHAHPVIAERISRQAYQLEQALFADFSHAPAVDLAERLVGLLQLERGRVFYSDNGSTAVETALKIALQYWYNRFPATPKTKIISFRNAYHGDTFGAMSGSGPSPFNRPFWPFMFDIEQIHPPYKDKEELSYLQMKEILSKGNAACFIFEPIVQGVTGMHRHSAEGLAALIDLCRQHEVITIADEVMTGFGRTGPLFACDALPYRPDITCLAKGLTGGFLPMGATVCKEAIYEGFLSDNLQHALLHGHSYCGNPLGCAAALASLDLLEDPFCSLQRQNIQQQHQMFVNEHRHSPRLARCDVIGTILVLEYKTRPEEKNGYFSLQRDRLAEIFLHHNILMRPFGNVLILMPPYCTQSPDLHHVYETIKKTLEND